MKNKFKSYSEYKNSGFAWIGRIPTHWEVHPNRALFSERKFQNTENEELLSVTITKGIIKQTELLENSSKKDSSNLDKSKYKLVMPGDVAYNKMRMWQGAVGASKHRGIVSPAYIVLKPRQNVHPGYYHFLFRTPQYIRESYRHSYGICDDQLSLRYEDFKVINSPLPPLKEQKTIELFLSAKHRQIASFIRNKRRLIELLKEQKQVIITQAVTRGIDPNVRLKPSGVDWLGDIPEHWGLRRLRTIAYVKLSGVDKKTDDNEQPIRLCNYVDVYKNDYIVGDMPFMNATAIADEIIKYQIKAGDVIITKDSEIWNDIAVPAYVPSTIEGVICAYHLAIVRPITKYIKGEFLFRAFCSEKIAYQFRVAANGVTRYGLSQSAIKSAIFPMPPKEEQSEIVEYIKLRCHEIDKVIDRAKHEIDLIRAYRTRLISDVVTGKIDVRDTPVEPIEELEDHGELDMVEEAEKQEETEELEEARDEDI